MDHLAQDLSHALEESESCGPIQFEHSAKWGMRRRTRSAGNLRLYVHKSADNRSEDSSSSASDKVMDMNKKTKKKLSFQSDSDELTFSLVSRSISGRTSLRMKHPMHPFLKARYRMSYSLESDSFNEHSPAKPNLRRKRKFKRMSIDETPIPPCGKRKRSQRLDISDCSRGSRQNVKIKPLHPSLVNKIEKFCQTSINTDERMMEIQPIDMEDNCEIASESSISWSGGEGHEGDDELTDWAPSMESSSALDQACYEIDPREIRAGCRRLGDERPGFSISTSANERVAKFLQDTTKSELRLVGAETEKLSQLAALYSLDLKSDGPTSSLLRKTHKTPCMQPTQRHHSGLTSAHKRIRTHDHIIS